MPYYNSSLADQYSNELGRVTLPIIGLLNNYNNYDKNNQEYDKNSNKIYGGALNQDNHSKFDRFKDLGIPALIIHQTCQNNSSNMDPRLKYAFTTYSSNEDSPLLNEDKFEEMFRFMLHGQSDKINPNKIKKSVTKSNRRPNKKGTKKNK